MAAHATGLERIELGHLRDRLMRLFALLEEASSTPAPGPGAWSPPTDICESDEAVMIYIELPGLKAEQIDVQLAGAQLRVSGERSKPPTRRRGVSHLCSERNYGRFERALDLRHWSLDVNQATADLKQGVLAVRLPKIIDRRGTAFNVPVIETGE